MPSTLSAVATMRTGPRKRATAGFSPDMPVMAGIFQRSWTALQSAPQAMPYRPAWKAGPATSRSGRRPPLSKVFSSIRASICSVASAGCSAA